MTADMILNVFDWAGVFVFALSGGLMAVRQRFDILGVIIIAWLPAIGGGTLRDLILDVPVFWLSDPTGLWLATLAGIAAFFGPAFWARIRALVWVDAMGLALFAVVGASKAAELGHGFLICTLMGAVTATAGGLLRDVVCNETPLLLREEIYATAAIFGAAGYFLAHTYGVSELGALSLGAIVAFVIRALSLKFKLNLPRANFER
ncbi:trimeric intracellular cation channel family protein [Litorimonas sp. RW-G-Af-16]|uniref:trimeric intracellular cation channel family protein n=1 Tax=Litorimonas sp. RW-G-Af-16 TaxID=3241168 RepID=UPI00390C5094